MGYVSRHKQHTRQNFQGCVQRTDWKKICGADFDGGLSNRTAPWEFQGAEIRGDNPWLSPQADIRSAPYHVRKIRSAPWHNQGHEIRSAMIREFSDSRISAPLRDNFRKTAPLRTDFGCAVWTVKHGFSTSWAGLKTVLGFARPVYAQFWELNYEIWYDGGQGYNEKNYLRTLRFFLFFRDL